VTEADLPDDLPVLSTETRRSAKLIGLFLKQAPIELGRLKEAIDGADGDELKSVAHKLKGSCRAVGVVRMAELCEAIERTPVSEVGSKYDRLVAEYERAKVLLEAEQSIAARS
jgi:HPt (histidine-containing phosphotransfer) domain-containing protein